MPATDLFSVALDPANGNLTAKVLLVLEAPGPGAVASKRVSINNDDPTARNLKALLAKGELTSADLIIWNVVPWYCGNEEKTKIEVPSAKDVAEGIESLCTFVALLKNLKAIVLVGSTARKAHVRLSAKTRARILSCHTCRNASSTPTEAPLGKTRKSLRSSGAASNDA